MSTIITILSIMILINSMASIVLWIKNIRVKNKLDLIQLIDMIYIVILIVLSIVLIVKGDDFALLKKED